MKEDAELCEPFNLKKMNAKEFILRHSEKFREAVDNGYGLGFEDYSPQGEPNLPEEIWVEEVNLSMPQWQDHTEKVYFGGRELFSISDNWGRKKVSLWPSKFDFSKSTAEGAYQDYKKACNKAYYESCVEKLTEKGFNKSQIKKFMCSRARWKWEIVDNLLHILEQKYLPKDFFYDLSQCQSHRKYDTICQKWQVDMFNECSLPRKTAYAQLIADMK